MINKFLTDIKIIKNAINTKKLVVFAGAGISIDAGVPSWGSLIDEIKKELDLPESETDYLKIPQIYYNERQEKEYIEKIRDVLGHKKLKHNEIHEEIFELNPEHVLTTNFEDLLEQVINKKSLPFSVVKEDKDLPYSHNTKLLIKVHGDLDSTSFVLKEDDYLNYSHNHPLIEAFIKSVFASKVVLFIGYSYNDYNLKQIVQNVRNILGSNFQNAYLLSTDNQTHESHKQYLKNKGINVVDYFDADFNDEKGDTQNYILDFLNGKNIYKEKYFQKNSSFSDRGQLLYNFLRFIRYYDELKIIITPENVVSQLYNSLDRFSELKSLPQNFISKLYPFKSSHEAEYLIEHTTLLLKNKIITDLFYNQIIIENNILIYKPNSDLKLTKNEISSNNKKLLKVVNKLNNSLIYNVTKENSKGDSFGYKGFSREQKDIIINTDEKCQCSKCKFERLQLDESLTDLNNYTINDITDVKDDVQKAYLNYKFGNYVVSFNMYEEIATKAWQLGKYITYYIAKNNMKSLKGLIRYSEENIDNDKKDEIISKIADIDIDKLISQIPYKSNEEYELLKIIRDDSILIDVKNEIDELYSKIEKTFSKYNKSQYYNELGPYYPQKIYIQIYKLLKFYTDNYIINDVFSNFRGVIQKGMKALLLSHATNKAYGGRLEKLSSDFFYCCLMYCDAKSLEEFMNENKIVELIFDQKEEDKIVDYCLNYFNSIFTKSNLYFNNSYKNDILFNQLSKDSFEGKMKSIFNNIMLFMLFVKIPEDKQEKFVEDLILFLEYERFLYGDGIKYLNWFIEKNHILFSKENSFKIVKIAHNKISKHEMNGTLDTISYVANQNKFEVLTDKVYTLKILSDYDYYDPRKSIIPALWRMSSIDVKNELKSILVNKLKIDFNEKLYVNACYSEIIDYNMFFEDYIELLNKINSQNKDKSNGYENIDGKLKLINFYYYNAILFLYHMGVKSTDVRLKKMTNLLGYMKFYIFRDKFDVSLFKVEWLELIDREIVFEELAKIKSLKKIISNYLKGTYNKRIAEIYVKYFI